MTNVEQQSGIPRDGAAPIPRDLDYPPFHLPKVSVDTADFAAIAAASEQQEYEHFLGVRAAGLTAVMLVSDDEKVKEREAARLLDDVSSGELEERAQILHGIIEHSRLNGAVEANIILRAQRDAAITRAEGILAIVRRDHPELIAELGVLAEKPIEVPSDLTSATAVIEQVLADSATEHMDTSEEAFVPAVRKVFSALGVLAVSTAHTVFPKRGAREPAKAS